MMRLAAFIAKLVTGGALDRVLDTVDAKVNAETDKEKIKGEIIKAHYATRGDYMRSGGFTLMLIFAVPLGVWFAAVCIFSLLLCEDCLLPVSWSIAALPPPLDEWAGYIIISIFGVIGVDRLGRK